MGILTILWPLIWRVLAVAAVIGAAVWSWSHFVANPYIERGVKQEMVHTLEWKAVAEKEKAANDTLRADLDSLGEKVKRANDALVELVQTSERVIQAKDKVLAGLQKKERSLKSEFDRLLIIANGPPAQTKEEACVEAAAILDALADRRLGAVPQ